MFVEVVEPRFLGTVRLLRTVKVGDVRNSEAFSKKAGGDPLPHAGGTLWFAEYISGEPRQDVR